FWGFNAYALSRGNDFGDVYQGEVENGRWGTRWGAFTLAPPQASNDAFADRIDLGSGISAAGSGSNVGYTGEPGEIAQSGTIHSAWWSWTAPSNGALDVDTFGSSFDTFLTLATGAAVNSLTGVASNDDSGGLQSRVTIDVTAGTQYQIAVDGYNENTGAIVLHLNFTAEGTEDFGDAPTAAQSGFAASYPTTLADNGPRHTPLAGFHLGTSIDTEGDGVPSAQANADDLTRGDDEDGVNFVGTPAIGAAEVVEVFLTNTAGVANPYLDAWIDFNQDGDWQDSGEQIYSGGVVAGSNAILFSVPANAQPGQTFARFRLHDGTSGLTVTGLAADGEVEDHLVSLAIPGVWVEQGPRGTINGQVESGTQPNERVAGAIHTVLAHPTDADTLYIGAVNGGIWKTTNATAVLPDWTPTTDFLHSLSIGAMAFDPTDTSHNTLVAATARYSSFGGIGGDRGAVYRSTDGADTWTELPSNGLSGENLSGVAARGDTIVVSSSVFAGGLFRSTDGGANFQPISSADFNSPGDNFTDLVVDESDPSGMRLYAANEAGGGPGGIYRSDDFGLTWTKVSGPGISADMEALLVNSSNIEMTVHPVSGRLYVAVLVSSQPQGIFYTDNGSSANPTWSQMDIPVLPVGSGRPLTGATNATPISITSAAHGLSSGQFVVINGVTGNTAANGFFRITVTGSDTFTLNGSEGNAAYVSGGTWTQVTGPSPSAKVIDEKTGAQGRIHFSIRVHPTDPDILFVGGDRQNIGNVIGDSTYGGAIFRGDASIPRDPSLIPSPQWDHATHDIVAFDASGGTVNGTAPHADSREMVFDANGNLIEVDDGGIFRRTSPLNNAGDWFSLAGNLGVIEFHDVAYDNNSNTLIGGTQDNGTHFQPAGQQWDMLSGGDGGDVVVDTVSMAATNQSVRYSSFQNLGGFRRSVWSSANALQSVSFPALTVSSGPPLTPQFKTPVELNAVDPNRLLFIGANGIYESTDQGATIALVGATHSVGFLQDATVYGGWQNGVPNPNVFYVGAGDDVRIRTAAGGAVTASDPDPSSGQTVRDVVMQSTNWAQAWAIDDDSVFQTNDAGLSWSDVTGNLMAIAGTALFSIQYVPGPIGALVVGGNLGVFTSLISSPHIWTEVGSNLPNAPAFDLQYDASDDVLVAGTLGRGAWTLPNASALLAGLPPAAPAVVPAGTLINGGANNRSGIHSMAFEFDQPVVATSAAALRLFNHTTGALVSTGGATLSGQGTTQLTWTALGELPNGRYTAEILASEVAGSGGNLAATYALEFHVLKGDLTGNATVDFADYAIVGANFDPLGGVSFREGDASGNGTVDFADYAVIGANFNPLGLPALTYDFGDASETGTSFLTTLPKGGAQHVIAGPRLGLTIDPEANGQPTIAADGDDTNGGLDEDGVAAFVMQPGRTANLVITATVTTTAVLNAWIDFDNNGDWDGPGEQIFVDEPLVDGSNSKSFSVPPNALVGNVNARFRLTEVGGYSHQGLAASGEVEDYLLPMTAAPPPSILAPPTDDGNVGLSLPETDAQQTQAAVVAEHDLVEQRACSPVSSAESSPLPEEDVSPHRLPEESPRTDGLVGPSQVRRSPEQDPAAFWAAEPSATVQAVAKRLPAEAVATEMLIFDQAQSDLPSQAVQEAWPTPAAHAAPEDVAWCPVWTADHEGEGIEQLVELLAFDVFEATGPRRPAG
ncbi:MAG: hypothetical protein KDA45_02450, partial [Planctomycetales bacterium]|nr:hypothetical protein [Planctomycetales bacterium]